MAAKMTQGLTISADWESLDVGSCEERACFSAIGIESNNIWLTEGRDALANRLRSKPLLSAYHLAEWMAWNWWRLRWEPRSEAEDWTFAHCLSSIGNGYVWPNITIFSDGLRTALITKSTLEQPQTLFRYISDYAAVIPASDFEAELDRFIDQVLQRLQSEKVLDTNLKTIWDSVCKERRTPELANKRKLEALLGYNPDEGDAQTLNQLIADGRQLSISAIEEIAADYRRSDNMLTADKLKNIAQDCGFGGSPLNVVKLSRSLSLAGRGNIAAWRIGSNAAKALRLQEQLGSDAISNTKLAEISGVQESVISDKKSGPQISFVLNDNANRQSRIVLRSKWEEGRRFELARLLGDQITGQVGPLFPATRSYTYRQKMQRSFAAELLSPFESVDEMLAGDYSMEKQQEVAEHFNVSAITIQTLLVNHKKLDRQDLDDALEVNYATASSC